MTNYINQVKDFYIWEGIYPDFQSAAIYAKGTGFKSEIYRTRSLNAATECLQALNLDKPIPLFYKQRSNLLPLTVAMMLEIKKELNILDFGGGLGIGYMTIIEALSAEQKNRIHYTIVEIADICQTAIGLEDRVIFRSDIPTSGKFNLIHAASSIQYVENWRDLIARFSTLNPEYILLTDVFAGSIRSFWTLQNYYQNMIPHSFLNLSELLTAFESEGYKLAMKSSASSRRLNV